MQTSQDTVWQRLREEAATAAASEPALQTLINGVVLERASLEETLATRLSRKLNYHSTPEGFLSETFLEVFHGTPSIGEQVRNDIIAIEERDPACESYLCPVLFFKGFQALTIYRIAHALWKDNRRTLALYLQSLVSEVFAVDIHPAAVIGSRILLDHATGFVAGETAVIEDDVSILHGVTLGGTGKEAGDRHPKVASGVLIGAGAKILGNIRIGECAKIGANSVVLSDVEPHTTVAGVPARPVGRAREDRPSRGMDHHLD